jgi:hypothetical protein
MSVRKRLPVWLFLALPALAWSAAAADEFRLERATFPAPILEHGRVQNVIEASGVEPVGDGRHVIIAHDKAAPLYLMDLASGELAGEPICSPRFPATADGGPKWEGMARDADGNFYAVGSHSGKTDQERSSKSHLVRFRLNKSAAPAIDDASVVRFDIARSLASALKSAGLDDKAVGKRKIEGLTVREQAGRRELVVGLRQPNDKVRALAADITNAPGGAALDLKPLFTFEADPREGVPSELTALEYVPALKGFLVVTASEDADNAFHGNTLWFVADGATQRARRIGLFEVAMKCEGLAVLSTETRGKATSVTLIVTFDNDPHATRIPSRYQTVTLDHEAD